MMYTRLWHDAHIDVWASVLPPLLPEGPRVWLEIGSWEGRSAAWTLDNLLTREGDELHCVDVWSRPDVEKNWDANVGSRAIKHKRRSVEFLLGDKRRYCGCYIDGSHDAPDVLADAVLAWRRLDVGGVMIFDDLRLQHPSNLVGRVNPGVAVEGFLAAHSTRLTVLHRGAQAIVQKRRE